MILKYEPASEPLHMSVKWLFLNVEQHQTLTQNKRGETAILISEIV
jgi:hypothetical protein